MSKPRKQKIRCRSEMEKTLIGGWLSGRQTYIRIAGLNDNCVDTLGGRSLYRLAKAIVRHYENDQP